MSGLFSSIGKLLSGGIRDHITDVFDPGNILHAGHAERAASKQWQLEYELSKKNYEHELEAYEYQKALNATQMEREDTAVQRRVADLRAAGLSPTLAAGSSASSTPVHAGSAPQQVAPSNSKVEAAMFKEQQQKDYLQLATSVLGNVADISRTKAETEFIKAQKGHQDIINKYEEAMLQNKIESLELSNVAQRMANSFNQLANPARLIEMRQAIELAKKKVDIAELDKEIKTNEKLRQIYYNSEAKFKAALAGKQVELADLKKENIDWDTVLKIYAYEYASDRQVPLSGNLGLIGGIADAAALLHQAIFGK